MREFEVMPGDIAQVAMREDPFGTAMIIGSNEGSDRAPAIRLVPRGGTTIGRCFALRDEEDIALRVESV